MPTTAQVIPLNAACATALREGVPTRPSPPPRSVRTKVRDLDDHVLTCPSLTVLTGAPGEGSSVAYAAAAGALTSHHPVLHLGWGTAAADVRDRVIAHIARVDPVALARQTVPVDAWQRVAAATRIVERADLTFDDGSPTTRELLERAHPWVAARRGSDALVVLDGFHHGWHDHSQAAVAVRQLTDSLGVAVLLALPALCPADRAPRLGEVSPSVAYVHAADAVFGIYTVGNERVTVSLKPMTSPTRAPF